MKRQIFLSVESVIANYARDRKKIMWDLSDIAVCGVVVERGFVVDDVELNFVLDMLFCIVLRV